MEGYMTQGGTKAKPWSHRGGTMAQPWMCQRHMDDTLACTHGLHNMCGVHLVAVIA